MPASHHTAPVVEPAQQDQAPVLIAGTGALAGLKAYLSDSGLEATAEVWFSSHLGGHRLAGVHVCYPSGNWYGRVATDDVAELVQAELHGSKPLSRL